MGLVEQAGIARSSIITGAKSCLVTRAACAVKRGSWILAPRSGARSVAACQRSRMDWRTLATIGLGILAVWAILIGLLFAFRPRGVPLGELLRVIPDVLRLVRGLIGDRTVPFPVKAALVVLMVWLLSPIDLIPEFIPVLGPVDDAVVAVLVLRYVRRRLGIEELRTRWAGTPEGFALLSRIIGSG